MQLIREMAGVGVRNVHHWVGSPITRRTAVNIMRLLCANCGALLIRSYSRQKCLTYDDVFSRTSDHQGVTVTNTMDTHFMGLPAPQLTDEADVNVVRVDVEVRCHV